MTGESPRQLVLDLAHRPALGREDFLVAESNRAAVGVVDRYPDWPHHAVVIFGPPGSGKSHLVQVWRQVSGAEGIGAAALREDLVPKVLSSGALAIDDAPGDALDERALFHLLNLARQEQARVLIATTVHPAGWPVALPDLASRLKALPVVAMGPPDDALLRGVLVKLFADRQLSVEESVISYLLLRMPRSFDAARAVVEAIDRRALEEKVSVSRSFAARVLEEFTAPGLFGHDD
ncbi:MAG: hypothetical protein KDK89_08320 [Alphaproteobacteria bacterium]|nr:hypothetical protein [Alphaproteobacteria bacterium]